MEVVITKKRKLASIKINDEELANFITSHELVINQDNSTLTITIDLNHEKCSLKLSSN